MTVYDIPNIEHCDVLEIGDPVMVYKITSHQGWYIHIFNENDELNRTWKTVIAPRFDSDFSLITIAPESELPSDAIICSL